MADWFLLGLDAILRLSRGDMRRALNTLQAAHLSHEAVTSAAVHACTGQPEPAEIAEAVSSLLNDDFSRALLGLTQLQTERGVALSDVIAETHLLVMRLDLPDRVKAALVHRLCDIEHALAGGASEKLQLSALVASFQEARDCAVKAGQAGNPGP